MLAQLDQLERQEHLDQWETLAEVDSEEKLV